MIQPETVREQLMKASTRIHDAMVGVGLAINGLGKLDLREVNKRKLNSVFAKLCRIEEELRNICDEVEEVQK